MSETHLAENRLTGMPSSTLDSLVTQGRLRVLSIAHSAFGDGSSRLRYHPLATDKSLDLTLLIPDKWEESGQKFTMGSEAGPLNIKVGAVRLQSVPKLNWYAHYYPSLKRLLHEMSPNVLHLWAEPWSILALHSIFLRDRYFPKMAVVLETDQNILRRLPPPFESIRRYNLKRTDMLIARAQEALDVSRACGYAGPSAFVEYVIPTDLFKPTDKETARSDFGISGFTIGYVGRLVPGKGLSTVLQALKACTRPVNFAIMGSGPELQNLKQQTADLGLADRVTFFASQPQRAVARFMAALDVLVLMSETQRTWKEQFGRVIIEAQACGTPVIGSSSGSIPFVTGRGGWIVPERDATALTQLLERLSCDPSSIASAAESALANTTRFTPEIVGAALTSALVGAKVSRQGAR